MFLFDDGDDYRREKLSETEAVQVQDRGSAIDSTEHSTSEPDAPPLIVNNSHSTTLTTGVPRTPSSIRRFAINLLTRPKLKKAPRDKRNVEIKVPENTMDIPEGTEPGSEPGEIVEVLHRSYDRCDGPRSAKRESSSINLPDTPPVSQTKTPSIIQDTSPASSTSTLSPVPSILSEQGRDEGMTVRLFQFVRLVTLTSTGQGRIYYTKHPKPAYHADKEKGHDDSRRCTESQQTGSEGIRKQV